MKLSPLAGILLIGIAAFSICTSCTSDGKNVKGKTKTANAGDSTAVEDTTASRLPVDTAKYDALLKKLANGDTTGKWPVKKQPYPLAGAILNVLWFTMATCIPKKWVPLESMRPRKCGEN